jgi:hypothetical protein
MVNHPTPSTSDEALANRQAERRLEFELALKAGVSAYSQKLDRWRWIAISQTLLILILLVVLIFR